MISLRVVIALAVFMVALTAVSAWAASPTRAADPTASALPSPSPAPIFEDPLDPRGGAGANRVGAPLLALVVVVVAGAATAALTVGFVRVTSRRQGRR